MLKRISRWLVFTVLLGIIALTLEAARLYIVPTNGIWHWTTVLEHGSLFLIAALVLSTAFGELIGSKEKAQVGKIVHGGISMFIILLAVGLYADISAMYYCGQGGSLQHVPNVSIAVFVASIFCGLGCFCLVKE